MSHRVVFDPDAAADLDDIQAYISEKADPETAGRFVGQLVDYCLSLGDSPRRGTQRDDLRPGLHLIGYRRRAAIAYVVTGDGVGILRIAYGGRDVARLLGD